MNNNKIVSYFLKEFLKSYFFILICFVLIVWIFQAIKLLELITDSGTPVNTYLLYTLFIIPKIIGKLSVIIFFISGYICFNKLENNNELKYVWLFFSKKILINYVFLFSFIFALILVLLKLFIVPYANETGRGLLLKYSASNIASFVKKNNFNNPLQNFTIYFKEKNIINEIGGIFINFKDESEIQSIIAKNGIFFSKESKNFLTLENGSIQNKKNENINFIEFDKLTLDLSLYKTKSVDYFKFEEINTIEILRRLDFKNLKKDEGLVFEMLLRIIPPLYIPTITLVLFFIVLSNRDFISEKKLKSFVLLNGVTILIFSDLLLNYTSKHYSLLYLNFLIPIILTFFSYFFLIKILKKENSIKYNKNVY